MELAAFEAVIKALNKRRVRYIVVGGVAVNAHGYIRTTTDIDLVVELESNNILRGFAALADIGFRPSVPVTAEGFSDPVQRQRWRDEKGMQVLNFHCPAFPTSTVDVFVEEPFDFASEYDAALRSELISGIEVSFVSIPALIEMKMAAGRPRDLDDIQHLEWIQEIEDGKE